MTDKKCPTYEAVFKYIDDNVFKMKPNRFMTDFEAGMRKALRKCFPSCILNGCWFHFRAAVRRKFRSLNLYNLIADDIDARTIYRKILNLPLLPTEHLLHGYEIIKQDAKRMGVLVQLKPIFEYFEYFWLELVEYFLLVTDYFHLLDYACVFYISEQRKFSLRRQPKYANDFIARVF